MRLSQQIQLKLAQTGITRLLQGRIFSFVYSLLLMAALRFNLTPLLLKKGFQAYPGIILAIAVGIVVRNYIKNHPLKTVTLSSALLFIVYSLRKFL